MILVLLIALAWASPAGAMEVGVSDDAALTYSMVPREPWWDRAEQIGSDSVRAVVYGNKSLADPRVDSFVTQANKRGLKPQLVLHWDTWRIDKWMTIAKYVSFAKRAVTQYKNVDRFSILNEPDLSLPIQPYLCSPAWGYHYSPEPFKRYRYKRVKRAHKRLYKRVKIKPGLRWKRQRLGTAKRKAWTRHGRYWIKKKRRVGVYQDRLFRYKIIGCVPQSKGAFYRLLFRRAYTAIKKIRPDAQVLFGETSPLTRGFTEHALCLKPTTGDCSRLVADGYAAHPYQWDGPPERCGKFDQGIGCLPRLQTLLKQGAKRGFATPSGKPWPLYLTEFGYIRKSRSGYHPMPPDKIATYAIRASDFAARHRAKQLVWYQLRPTVLGQTVLSEGREIWDTHLPDEAIGPLGKWAEENSHG